MVLVVVLINNIGGLKFGQRPRLRWRCFCGLIWGNLILSLLNKINVNCGTVGRHGGSVFDG